MLEDRQRERRLRDEDVALDHFKRRAGRVGLALIVAAHHNTQAIALHRRLRRAQHVPGRMQRKAHVIERELFAVAQFLLRAAKAIAIARAHDRQRLRRRQHASVSGARMIGMPMRDQRPGHRARRIDVEFRLRAIEALRLGTEQGAGLHARKDKVKWRPRRGRLALVSANSRGLPLLRRLSPASLARLWRVSGGSLARLRRVSGASLAHLSRSSRALSRLTALSRVVFARAPCVFGDEGWRNRIPVLMSAPSRSNAPEPACRSFPSKASPRHMRLGSRR